MAEQIIYHSDAHDLDRLRRVFRHVHKDNRTTRPLLLNAIAYELEREGLKFKTGPEITTQVDFHVYEPFVADIIIGSRDVTAKLLLKLPVVPSEGPKVLSVVVLRNVSKPVNESSRQFDLIYTYGI